MEKVLAKAGRLKVSGLWISKKAKQEFSSISDDISTLSNTVEEKAKWLFNRIKGDPERSLPDVLHAHNLPPGLFPYNIIKYELDKGCRLIVHMRCPGEVTFKDGLVIRYAERVKCVLLRGKLVNVDGMKMKAVVWVRVTSVELKPGFKRDDVCFTAGVNKSKPRDLFSASLDAVPVKHF